MIAQFRGVLQTPVKSSEVKLVLWIQISPLINYIFKNVMLRSPFGQIF